MIDFIHFHPTKVIFGFDSLKKLKYELDLFGFEKILLVTGKHSMKKMGITDKVINMLSPLEVFLYDRIDKDLNSENLQKMIFDLKDLDFDVIIALGGGSVIDACKSFSILHTNKIDLYQYLSGYKAVQMPIPIIAIPTTCGTSSELTKWATIWDLTQKRKFSISDVRLYPKISIIDPNFFLSLSKLQTVLGAFDALSHAFESFWSLNSTPLSEEFASQAIDLIMNNIEPVFLDGNDAEGRIKLALGVLYSGYAFSQTKTGICHALSYYLTLNHGVRHGQAVGVFLPVFVRSNYPYLKSRYSVLLNKLKLSNADTLAARIDDLMLKCDMKTRLGELNVQKEDLDHLVSSALTYDRSKYNPKQFSQSELKVILESML